MANTVLENGLAVCAFARHVTVSFLDGVPVDKWLQRPCAGGNHAMWIAGHIAWEDDDLLVHLKPRSSVLPEGWAKLFGMGSTPSDDASVYPEIARVRAVLGSVREEVIAWFRGMDDARLVSPLPGDWAKFAPNYGALMAAVAWHEGTHAGQLSVVRKSLGLKPRFG